MPRLVRDNLGKHFIVDFSTGKRYEVTGAGQLRAAEQLYGQAITSAGQLPAEWRQRQQEFRPGTSVILLDGRVGYQAAGTVVQLFGGPNEIEQVVAGLKPDPLTGEFTSAPQTADTQTGVTFEPTPTTDAVEGGTAEPVDYLGFVRATMPWMPAELAQIYADGWASTGDAELAMAQVRQHERYDDYFPGMRRGDGTLRFGNEAEYLATRIGHEQVLLDHGLNPAVFMDQVTGLIEGETSPQEFAQRVSALDQGIARNAPEVRAFFAQNYGLDLSSVPADATGRAALLAMAADTDVGTAILTQQIAVSQVGGEASRFGFTIGAEFAESLTGLGVGQEAARQVFGAAQRQLPALESMAVRFGDPDRTVELGEFTGAMVEGDLAQQRRFERLSAQERAQFTPQGGAFARDRQGFLGGLIGR